MKLLVRNMKIGLVFLSFQVMCLSTVNAAYYKWTDEQGNTHYSASVPPEQVKRGHIELDSQGLTKQEIASEAKRKQLEEIAKLKEEKEAQAKIDAEINKRQAEEDNLLLSIFNNEEEIAKSYDSRLELADVTIKLLKDRHKAQSERLEELEQRHEKMVNIKHKQKMQKQIDSVLDNLKIYQQAITENVIEKDKVSNDYVETLTRFRELLARNEAKESL